MATKSRTVLNMQQRLNILKEFEDTALSLAQIARKYGVHRKTILRIKKNAIQINTFASKSKREKLRRRIVEPVYDELDKRLITWFVERRTLGDRLSDALILQKATEMKKDLPGCSHFKVSRGWLRLFKRRHGIRLVNMYGEKACGDETDENTFINNFKQMIEEENIRLENVYTMDKTGLVWKALPTKTVAGENERSISFKTSKDRITVGLCANALGTHKLMPLVVYKYKKPRALKHEVCLPVVFKSQANAWMNRELFVDWFENYFKPSVKDFQEHNGISGRVILLLDNCAAHKVAVETEDTDFKIMYLPPNTTCLIQPMDQGIIEKTKRTFRHKLLQRVLTYDGDVNAFYKDYTLKTCIHILAAAWSEITQSNVRNAWNHIIGPASNGMQRAVEPEPDLQEAMSIVIGEKCEQEGVTQYLANCEQEEGKIKEEDYIERHIVEEEPLEEPLEEETEESSEIIYEGHSNEVVKIELRQIFERLVYYSARSPTWIQCMVQGLKIFFLGKEY